MYMPNSFKINEKIFSINLQIKKKKKQTNKQTKKKKKKKTIYNLVFLSIKDKMYKVWNFK